MAHANIAPALLLGQALAWSLLGRFSWVRLLLAFGFGVLDHLFIVFANDCADWRADVTNTTHNIYSGGSRVVPEGKLSPRQLAEAALLMVVLMGMLSFYVTLGLRLMWMLLLCAAAVFLLWAYSFPPFKLSYRGRGELLQALGVGALLPLIGFYLQAERLDAYPPLALVPSFLLGYAGNLTTALPDVPSDRATGKRSYPVRRGQRAARRDSLLLIALAVLVAPFAYAGGPTLAWLPALVLPLGCVLANVAGTSKADATEQRACFRFVTLNGAAIAFAQLGWIIALIRS